MKNLKIDSENGEIAIRSYGENGKDILFVHGTGQNLEVWEPLAELLKDEYRIWTFDTRGHGQTTLKSENATQYWKDINQIINDLNIKPILLVGHSTGGFSISAYTVWKQSKTPIMILDGFVLDKYKSTSKDHPSKIPKETLWELFRYDWKTSVTEKEDYIEKQAEKSLDSEDFNYGIQKKLITKVLDRCFFSEGNKFLRKPTFEEIEIVGNPSENEEILPDVNLYSRINSPIAFVLAKKGFYYKRKKEIENIIFQKTNRFYYEIDTTHNLPMTEPNKIKEIIIKFLSKK